jgi:hypothetical protein
MGSKPQVPELTPPSDQGRRCRFSESIAHPGGTWLAGQAGGRIARLLAWPRAVAHREISCETRGRHLPCRESAPYRPASRPRSACR